MVYTYELSRSAVMLDLVLADIKGYIDRVLVDADTQHDLDIASYLREASDDILSAYQALLFTIGELPNQ